MEDQAITLKDRAGVLKGRRTIVLKKLLILKIKKMVHTGTLLSKLHIVDIYTNGFVLRILQISVLGGRLVAFVLKDPGSFPGF